MFTFTSFEGNFPRRKNLSAHDHAGAIAEAQARSCPWSYLVRNDRCEVVFEKGEFPEGLCKTYPEKYSIIGNRGMK